MKSSLLSLSSLISLYFSLARARDVHYNFDIVNANLAPDGHSRAGILVNGVFPGTLIQAQKTDTLHIKVNNHLTNPDMR
jgi:iron transport multicopper oxidase